jgi:uncharacterized membrane protein YeaQ/YmgE (transglycosylase-associated protein family)
MNPKEQKLISPILIISLLILPMTLTANERRGTDVKIYKIKTQVKPEMEETPWERVGPDIKGELIAVKQNSLLLKDSRTGADVSVDIADIKMIKIVKKSKFLLGSLIGGVGAGLATQLAMSEEYRMDEGTLATLVYGFIGALLGGMIGAYMGTDKTIQIAGKSDSEIKEVLEGLRKKARVPDFQ